MVRMGRDPNFAVLFILYCKLKGIIQIAVAVVSFHMEFLTFH